jgi:hypothetical protein
MKEYNAKDESTNADTSFTPPPQSTNSNFNAKEIETIKKSNLVTFFQNQVNKTPSNYALIYK